MYFSLSVNYMKTRNNQTHRKTLLYNIIFNVQEVYAGIFENSKDI
jgi:hypothetical protein